MFVLEVDAVTASDFTHSHWLLLVGKCHRQMRLIVDIGRVWLPFSRSQAPRQRTSWLKRYWPVKTCKNTVLPVRLVNHGVFDGSFRIQGCV
jgi:hypothetical protein